MQRALTQLNELTASGDTRRAAALLSAAQRAAPANPDFAVRQLEVCLQANQLVCAAHSARALLRHAPAEHPEICRFLASARAFGARAAGLRWCPPAEPCTRSVANASADGGVVALAKLRWLVCRRTRPQPPCETFLLGCTCSEMKAFRCSLQSRAAVVSMNGGTKSMKSSGSSW